MLKFLFTLAVFVTAFGPIDQEPQVHSQPLPFEQDTIVPEVIQLTNGPMQHWSGYYDKWQVDPSDRYVLASQVDVFFRSPTPSDTLSIGLIDLHNDNKWQQIGTSTAWGWQQGCMLQWIPGSDEEVIWNDHSEEGGFIAKIYNVRTGEHRILPRPIYTLSPDGEYALCVDFDRLQFFRPGYGYPVKGSQLTYEKAPKDQGIYKMDLSTGQAELIISYADIAKVERSQGDVSENFHWFNHLLINPSGTRFIFLNRSRPVASTTEMSEYLKQNPDYRRNNFSSSYVTRAMTADVNGKDIFSLNDSGQFSHFIWKGDDEICAWAVPDDRELPGFFDFQDKTKKYKAVGEGIMTVNGHNTYVPGTNYEWILNDTYPQGIGRLQELYLFHVPTERKITLGKFHEPIEFKGEWRCDLHPKTSQDGKFVLFDSTHKGDKRQIFMIEIADIIANWKVAK